jgi:hypothetical protein
MFTAQLVPEHVEQQIDSACVQEPQMLPQAVSGTCIGTLWRLDQLTPAANVLSQHDTWAMECLLQ